MTEQQENTEGQHPGAPVYLALGRFVVEFSQLVEAMHDGVILVAAGRDSTAVKLWKTALSAGVAADGMKRIFFAVCSSAVDLNESEKRIRNLLNKQVGELIERRNVIAHGYWTMPVAHVSREGGKWVWDQPWNRWAKASKEGISFAAPVTVDEAEALADEMKDLAPMLYRFAEGCAPSESSHVSDRLQVRDGRVVRFNPPVDG